MELIIHPGAAKDAREIAAKYAEVSGELVDRFWNELDNATDGIASFPERHHYDPSGLRRSNLEKFPYHVLFCSSTRSTCCWVPGTRAAAWMRRTS